MTTKPTYCLLVFLWLCFETIGQVPNLNLKRYTKKEGLSNNNITAFAQTPDGFLWVGTTDGLNRFGGNDFKVFRHHPKDTSSISDNSITALLVDRQGVLWIGTEHQGLLKYLPESETFERFYHHPDQKNSLSHPYVTSIKEDVNNQLWIGTVMGLNLYNSEKKDFKRYFYETNFLVDTNSITKLRANGLPPKIISKLTTIKDSLFQNQLLFDNALKGIFSKHDINIYQEIIYTNSNKQNNASHIRVAEPDSKGNLWLGYDNGGLSYFNPQTNHMISFNGGLATVQLEKQKISALLLENNFLWLGFSNGELYKMDLVSGDLLKVALPSNAEGIESLFKDNKGNLWIGSHSGIYLREGDMDSFNSYGINPLNDWNISTPAVKTIFQSRHEYVWIGIVQGGISQVLKDMPFNTYTTDISSQIQLSKNCVSSILEDSKGRVWVGYYTSGIDIWDKTKGSLQHISFDEKDPASVGNGTVFSIFEDSEGRIWVGTYEGGLQEYIPVSNNFKTYTHNPEDENTISGNDVRSIKEDGYGNLWLAIHGGGLNKFNKTSGKVTRYSANYLDWEHALSDDWVYALEIDKKGNIWIGSVAGLTRFLPSKNEFYTYNTKNSSLSHDKVRVIHEDDKGLVWVGTENGLNKFDPATASFKVIPSDGKWDNTITGISSDNNGKLWAATKYSIIKVNQDNSDFILTEFKAFNENEFFAGAFTSGDDGTMYFGGFQGLLSLNPNSLKNNHLDIPIVLTSMKINNEKSERLSGKIDSKGVVNDSFRHNQNYISFNYEGINFDHTRQLKYAYKLQGYDRSWNFSKGTNEAIYSNIPSGNYEFVVKASSGNDDWSDPQILLRFEIQPPWWKSAWALSVYLIFVLGLIFVYRWLGIRNEKRKGAKKLELVQLSFKEQIDELKLKFYEDISKDLEAPFNLIKGTLQKLISENDNIQPNTRLTYLKLVNQNTRRAIGLVKQLSDISSVDATSTQLHIVKYDIVDYCKLVINAFIEKANRESVNLNFYTDIDTAEVYFDIDKLEKILYSLISHCFSYTPKNGEIKIRFMFYDGETKNDPVISELISNQWQFAKITIEHEGSSSIKKKVGVECSNEKHLLETQYAVALAKQLTSVHKGSFNLSFQENRTQFTICIPVSSDAFHPKQIRDTSDITEKIKDLESYNNAELEETLFWGNAMFDEKTASATDQSPFIIQLYEIIDAQLQYDSFGPDDLAEYMNLSRSQLYKKVKSLTNLSVSILIRNRRLSRSLALLLNTDYNISQIAYAVGFSDPGYFTKCFKEMYGKAPSEFNHAK